MSIDLEAIEARVEAATAGPWETGVAFYSAGVNDGSHKGWVPPSDIRPGMCAWCRGGKHPLVGQGKDEQGGSIHTHRVEAQRDSKYYEWWRTVESASTFETIVGGYDYDAGGVASSSVDAEFIAHARQDVPALIAEVKRLRDEVRRMRALV